MHSISGSLPHYPTPLSPSGDSSGLASESESATHHYLSASDDLFNTHLVGAQAPCNNDLRGELLPAQWAALEALAVLANRREITALSTPSSEIPLPGSAQLGAYLHERVTNKCKLRSSAAAFENPLGSRAPSAKDREDALGALRHQNTPLSRRLETIESIAVSLQRNHALAATGRFLHAALQIARAEVLSESPRENHIATIQPPPGSEPLTGVRLTYAPHGRPQT